MFVTCQLWSQRSGPRLTPVLRRALCMARVGSTMKKARSHTLVCVDSGVLLDLCLKLLDCVLCTSVSAILTVVLSLLLSFQRADSFDVVHRETRRKTKQTTSAEPSRKRRDKWLDGKEAADSQLHGPADQELAYLIASQWKGTAQDSVDIMEVEDTGRPLGLQNILQILDQAHGKLQHEPLDGACATWDLAARRNWQSVCEWIDHLKKTR